MIQPRANKKGYVHFRQSLVGGDEFDMACRQAELVLFSTVQISQQACLLRSPHKTEIQFRD